MLEGYIQNKKSRSDFVVPVLIDNQIKFIGVETKKEFNYGRIVYVGVDINGEILFNKLKKFNHDNIDINLITEFLNQLTIYKMSDILEPDNDIIIKKSSLKLLNKTSILPK